MNADIIITNIANKLKEKHLNISLAESITGGKIASSIVELSGVSVFFLGSIVAYDNSIKKRVLKVTPQTLSRFGAVSQECAKEMALGAKNLFKSDISISVTGIAGPTGHSSKKPVGLVYAAFITPEKQLEKSYLFSGNRLEIIKQTSEQVLKDLLELL